MYTQYFIFSMFSFILRSPLIAVEYIIYMYLYDIQTHIDNMFRAGAVVPGSGVALQCIAEVSVV